MIPLFAVAFQFMCAVGAVTNFNFNAPPERILYAVEDNRIRGFSDYDNKDFVLGGLFAVHASASGSAGGRCGTSLVRSGPERIEAFLYALDLINNDPNLLPNITLGYDIRDTCVSENVALDESADLIFTQGLVDCDACFAGDFNESSSIPVSAVIGATTSQVSISVASFLRLFTTPQVSYSASSPILNNRDRYGYFYRTIPPDDLQAQAMIDLMIEFGWNFVSVIHSNNAYGESGIDIFRQLAPGVGVCIDLDLGIDDDFTVNDYYDLASRVISDSSPNVIVFFASLQKVEQFFEQFKIIQESSENQRHFLWIASDSWAQAANIMNNYAEYVAGLWGFLPDTNTKSNYNDYFSQLTLSTNKRNPWYAEYYEDYNNCSVNITCLGNVSVADNSDYTQRAYIQLVIDAVYSISHALNNFLLDNCDFPVRYDRTSQTCQGQKNVLNGSILRDYLQNVNFTSPSGNHISFDSFGNIEGRYEITNFQLRCKDCTDPYEFVNTGYWDGTRQGGEQLKIFNVSQQFGLNETGQPLLSLQSQCQQCELGFISLSVQSSCCGTCSPCLGQNYTNTTASSECSTCPDDMWGNDPLNRSDSCQTIKESYLDPSDAWGIVLIIVAVIGLTAVVLVCIAMGFFWNTPIIKSSGREQMVLLLIGITLCFLIIPFFIITPSLTICLFQRAGTWLCFSLILCALFVKLVRIARVFLRDQTSGRPKFIEPIYQIIFTLVLVGFQMVLVIISLVVVYPHATTERVLNSENTNDVPTLVVACATPHIALIGLQMFYYTVLLIASNTLAMLTIQFPANFNEVRYVAFSTFFIGIIWIAFVVIFFAIQGNREVQTAIISFAIQMSALAVLICMFGSRIFIMIVWPSKNVSGGMNTQEHTMVPFSTILSTVRGSARSKKSVLRKDIDIDDFTSKYFKDNRFERKQNGSKNNSQED